MKPGFVDIWTTASTDWKPWATGKHHDPAFFVPFFLGAVAAFLACADAARFFCSRPRVESCLRGGFCATAFVFVRRFLLRGRDCLHSDCASTSSASDSSSDDTSSREKSMSTVGIGGTILARSSPLMVSGGGSGNVGNSGREAGNHTSSASWLAMVEEYGGS